MLFKIKLDNINSIDKCEIDFTKGSYKFLADNILGDVVNPMAIYGHNGSGKTAVLRGLGQLIDLMILPPNLIAPFLVNDFKLREGVEKHRNKKGVFEEGIGTIELFFEINNKNYEYKISTAVHGFVYEESLTVDNKKVFSYSSEKGLKYRKDSLSVYQQKSLIPFLRQLASSKIQDEEIQLAFAYISNFTFVDLPLKNNTTGGFIHSKIFNNTTMLDLLVAHSEEVKQLLSRYEDFPIYTIKKNSTAANLRSVNKQQYFITLEDDNFSQKLDISFISTGMLNNSLLLSILLSLPENSFLFIDEIETALHPTAIEAFLTIVREKNIQLLFTSHNTNILEYLRPDQIYFAKWRSGYSKYYKLSNIYQNIREVNNIEKMYLSKVFDRYMND